MKNMKQILKEPMCPTKKSGHFENKRVTWEKKPGHN